MSTLELGVCYYPEHWEEQRWAYDFKKMEELGIKWVRIGEFAWSVLEPEAGKFNFEWLDRAMDLCRENNLKVILGTPTATPPIWVVERYADMLAVDEANQPRKFGSRRHYCFSHEGYFQESARIVGVLAERYSEHPALAAWQTDNEYGCHDTVVSYSKAARLGFVQWLKDKYEDIDNLNEAWGNRFWSMKYQSFSQVGLPNQTVTEANPAHHLNFLRYSSDQVVKYNRIQTNILRKANHQIPLVHNYMGQFTAFNHYKVAEDLDIASWDSYPLGFLALQDNPFEVSKVVENRKTYFMTKGDPDFQAFHHELYYGVSNRLWIMEQQPGPVNWAPYNPIPEKGMVRLWTWEAFFHGAEMVSYFRWRQAPWAQEQMHAGLLTSYGEEGVAWEEVRQIAHEIEKLQSHRVASNDKKSVSTPSSNLAGQLVAKKALKVAIIFDYLSDWAWMIHPHSAGFSYLSYILLLFRSLRELTVPVEIISSELTNTNLEDYQVVFIPLLFTWNDGLVKKIEENYQKPMMERTTIVFGPRTGGKSVDFSNQYHTIFPEEYNWFPIKVSQVGSVSANCDMECVENGKVVGSFRLYYESLELSQGVETIYSINVKGQVGDDGLLPGLVQHENHYYLAGCGDKKLLQHFIGKLIKKKKITRDLFNQDLGDFTVKGLRLIPWKNDLDYWIAINYSADVVDLTKILDDLNKVEKVELVIGKKLVAPADITVFKVFHRLL